MSEKQSGKAEAKVDYSSVTPATGIPSNDKNVTKWLTNQMPTADTPRMGSSARSDPDKVIPGAEAASDIDAAEEEWTQDNLGK